MPSISTHHNQPEYSVSEISGALKRVVEDTFGYVRVRGEISGFKRAASGHLYLDLKDANAVLNAVCWKGMASRFTFKPEDGVEVICTGKLTTYAGRSNYQMVIESMEPAGAGALMALLEKRKQALAAEGLFDASRKRALPYLPQVIGVITSPTGAVIQDILHRIADRFPLHVLVCPVRVQGEGAAEEVTRAIMGMNALEVGGAVPRPDVLIVARGGGSLEDLWAFNEEIVVRAAAASQIPLISAVGHETDTTLIDYAADVRAPTPTAAAEMAVPVREELLMGVKDLGLRSEQAVRRVIQHAQVHVDKAVRGLPRPMQLWEMRTQRVDEWGHRLQQSLPVLLQQRQMMVERMALRLVHPQQRLRLQQQALQHVELRLQQALPRKVERYEAALQRLGERVQPQRVAQTLLLLGERLDRAQQRVTSAWQQQSQQRVARFTLASTMLENLAYHRVLARGFAVVRDAQGKAVTQAAVIQPGVALSLELQDGTVKVTA